MIELQEKVNVAPSSTDGHYVSGAKNVVKIDDLNESFYVQGSSILESKNHTSLNMDDDCLITCQQVYNPLSKMFEKSLD